MITAAPEFDLDDADRLIRDDHRGVLRSAASAGGQCRAVATAVTDGALAGIDGLRPRAVILLARGRPAAEAAALVEATLAPGIDVPVARLDDLPEWAGPLDLVVAAGDDAGDPRLAAAVAEALRRGAATVLTAPPEGPVGAAAGTRALLLPPRVPVLAGHRTIHHAAAILAVLAAARPARCARITGADDPAEGLSALADLLDAEALSDSPGRESFRNPAKGLTVSMLAREVVLAGADGPSTAVARCAAADLLATAGCVAAGAALSDALTAPVPAGGGGVDPIFHDDELDGPRAAASRRVFVIAGSADGRAEALTLRAGPLADAELISAAPADSGGGADGPSAAAAAPVLARCILLVVRLHMAAAYLAVASAAGGARPAGDGA